MLPSLGLCTPRAGGVLDTIAACVGVSLSMGRPPGGGDAAFHLARSVLEQALKPSREGGLNSSCWQFPLCGCSPRTISRGFTACHRETGVFLGAFLVRVSRFSTDDLISESIYRLLSTCSRFASTQEKSQVSRPQRAVAVVGYLDGKSGATERASVGHASSGPRGQIFERQKRIFHVVQSLGVWRRRTTSRASARYAASCIFLLSDLLRQ